MGCAPSKQVNHSEEEKSKQQAHAVANEAESKQIGNERAALNDAEERNSRLAENAEGEEALHHDDETGNSHSPADQNLTASHATATGSQSQEDDASEVSVETSETSDTQGDLPTSSYTGGKQKQLQEENDGFDVDDNIDEQLLKEEERLQFGEEEAKTHGEPEMHHDEKKDNSNAHEHEDTNEEWNNEDGTYIVQWDDHKDSEYIGNVNTHGEKNARQVNVHAEEDVANEMNVEHDQAEFDGHAANCQNQTRASANNGDSAGTIWDSLMSAYPLEEYTAADKQDEQIHAAGHGVDTEVDETAQAGEPTLNIEDADDIDELMADIEE